jgi:AcrR family transcriptional regulator
MSPSPLPMATGSSGTRLDARRKLALAAARAIAAEGGYEALTMHAVARRSGVSRAALYRYFASKDQLLMEVSLEFNAGLQAELERDPPRGASLAERVTDSFARVFDAFAREPNLLAALLRAFLSNDPQVDALAPQVRGFGGTLVGMGLGGADIPQGSEIARVLGPLSFAMAVQISAGHCTRDQATDEIRHAACLLIREP